MFRKKKSGKKVLEAIGFLALWDAKSIPDRTREMIERKRKIIGTYIHGWLESPEVTQKLLALLTAKTFDIPLSFQETKEREMDELALFLEEHCEVEKILAN